MHRSVYDKLKAQTQRRGPGAIFATREFLTLGSRASVDAAFSRLAREGAIRRLSRGLYDCPRIHPLLGPIPPDPEQVAHALARKNGSRLQPAGAQVANILGLSTQIPARPVYLTDGRTRSVRVGSQTIELRHASPRRMAGAEGLVIEALRHLGAGNIGPEAVQKLQETLSPRQKAALQRQASSAPAWLMPAIHKIVEGNAGESNLTGNTLKSRKATAG